MRMPDIARRYTVDEVLAFPADGNRYQLVDGDLLVTPAPGLEHQAIVVRLLSALIPYLSAHDGAASSAEGEARAGERREEQP